MSYLKNLLPFLCVYGLTYPLRFLSYKTIHKLGRKLGTLAYYLLPKFRKRTLSNLAKSAIPQNEKELISLAKASLQSLMITCLEYAKLDSDSSLEKLVSCENPKEASDLLQKHHGVIFFCAHQANWELLFLEGTKRMPGVAIGRPIKNTLLYQWILSIREKNGGKIITPKQAVKEGLRALKKGSFLGIVGDQGMPDSGYKSLFFGKTAWTSPLPALLSYKTGVPLFVATTKRENGYYTIHYSEPVFPNKEKPMEEEVDRLMKFCLKKLEESIRMRPSEWMFCHNRWKQQLPGRLKKRYRHDTLLIILPDNEELLPLLSLFRKAYPLEEITLYTPEKFLPKIAPYLEMEIIPYKAEKECFRRDYRFKILFNFTKNKALNSHFSSLSCQEIVYLKNPSKETIQNLLEKTLYASL